MSQNLKLFVNYRRADEALFVENMRTHFMYRYGRENVFMDFDTIPPFTLFEDFIRQKVRECDALVAVIGPRWLELMQEKEAEGKPDYVRIEIEEALKHGKVVAPICIQGGRVPPLEQIPDHLRVIFERNVPELQAGRHILDNIQRIMEGLEKQVLGHRGTHIVTSPIWNVPYHRNPNFVGRKKLLDGIRTSLTTTDKTAVIQAVSGMGGVGKTQLAVEYAYVWAYDYSCVWWLHSEETSTLINDYIKLGEALGVPSTVTTDQLQVAYEIRRWLEINEGWLLIFDNAIDMNSLKQFIPQGAAGHTIITSRNPIWEGIAHTVSISTLDREDSIALIHNVTKQNDLSIADQLAYALGDLPLALAQATAYIVKTGTSLSKYLNLFRSQRTRIQQQEAPPADYPDTLATTWLINIQSIDSQKPQAIDLLNLISFLGSSAIPLSLLNNKPSLLPSALSDLVKDDLELNNAIASLLSYSLLDVYNDTISLHRLVQAITRDHLSTDQANDWSSVAVRLVRTSFPQHSDKIEYWGICANLLPHALASASHAMKLKIEQKAVSWLLNQVGMFLLASGNPDKAKDILRRAYDIANGKIGDTEYDRLC